ncbi:ribonuclease H [Senna tora]|uniref:Ribonuclease H n=1 Tax=Senna tora TaxID=362788 RepID=A0A834WFS2_9FABA|nr:ribonuclease H [Senna tora]
MQSTRIPHVTCSEIEKLQRNFVWGHPDNERKPHHVGWKTVCSPKSYGGLGIKRLAVMNNAANGPIDLLCALGVPILKILFMFCVIVSMRRKFGKNLCTPPSLLYSLARISALFEEGFVRPSNAHARVMEYIKEVNCAKDIFDSNRLPGVREATLVAWEKPSDGWIKVNSDGACKSDGKAGCGAILRDHEGRWIGGIARNLDGCSVIRTEAWGAFEGIKLASDMGYKRIELESDSNCLVTSIIMGFSNLMEVADLIEEILLLVSQLDGFRVKHRWRETNSCADFLANLGASSSLERQILLHPPAGMESLLLADCLGIQVPRGSSL